MKRNYSLDVLKFVGILAIIIHHSLILEEFKMHLYIFVEMFFMISGYLIAMRYERIRNGNILLIMKNKIAKMYPDYFFAWILLFIVEFVGYKSFPYQGNIFKMIAELTMTSGWYAIGAMNSPIWYISVMILVEFIIMCLIKYSKNRKAFIATSAVVSVLLYSIMIWHSPNIIEDWDVLAFVFYVPVLRGLADMLIGCLIFFLSEFCKEYVKNASRMAFNLLYFILIALFIVLIVNRSNDYLCVPVIFLLVTLATFDKCVLNLKDGRVARFMIKYQYCIYLNHFCMFLIYGKIGKYLSNNYMLQILSIWAFTIIATVIYVQIVNTLEKTIISKLWRKQKETTAKT